MSENLPTIWLDLLGREVLLNIARRLDIPPTHTDSFCYRSIYSLALASPSLTAFLAEALQYTINIQHHEPLTPSVQHLFLSAFFPHLKVLKLSTTLPNPDFFLELLKAPNLSSLSIPAHPDLLPLLPAVKNLHHLTLQIGRAGPPHALLLQTFNSISPKHLTLRLILVPRQKSPEPIFPFTEYPSDPLDGTRTLAQACTSVTHLDIYCPLRNCRLFAWTFASHCAALTDVAMDLHMDGADSNLTNAPVPLDSLPDHVTRLTFTRYWGPLRLLTPVAHRLVEVSSILLNLSDFQGHPPLPTVLASFTQLRRLGIMLHPSCTESLPQLLQAVPQLESLTLCEELFADVNLLMQGTGLIATEPDARLGRGMFFAAVRTLPMLRELRLRGMILPTGELKETLRWFGGRLRLLEVSVRHQLQPAWWRVLEVVELVGEFNPRLTVLELNGLKGLGDMGGREMSMILELRYGQVVQRLVGALGVRAEPLRNARELERMIEEEVRVLRLRLLSGD